MQISIPPLQQLDSAAQNFIEHYLRPALDGQPDAPTHFAFYGEMGAGKTTFITSVCHQLGVTDVVNSPSFSIVNEYQLPRPADASAKTPHALYHFDFYRIKSIAEVYDIGYEDYFYSPNFCFIEWPELIESLLPDDTVRIHIQVTPDHQRQFVIEP